MNLNCPKCNSEDTQKLSLVMTKGGTVETGAKLVFGYVTNIFIPILTVGISITFGIIFGLFNIVLGLIAFVGVLFGGYTLRKWVKGRAKSKYADLPAQMKQSGFQCNRCEHLFIPAT